MTGPEFRTTLDRLGSTPWNARHFFAVSIATVFRWAKNGPPDGISATLALLTALRLTLPAAEAIAHGRDPEDAHARALLGFVARRPVRDSERGA